MIQLSLCWLLELCDCVLEIYFFFFQLKVLPKGLLTGMTLPPTGMAAHAIDELADIEEENVELAELASAGNEVAEVKGLPLSTPPLPSVHKNSYSQVFFHLFSAL